MPKPLFGDNGSGMHVHQSLWKDGVPLFFDELGYGGLSDIARWYIGGLLHHAPSLLAFTNPTVNSYHRLVPGFEAPVNLVYSAAQPLGRDPHPGHGHVAQGQAHRVPRARPVEQPVPRVLGACSWPASTASRTRSSRRPGRQGPLRAAAGGARDDPAGAGSCPRSSRRSRPTTTT
jgi:hypothetical protein